MKALELLHSSIVFSGLSPASLQYIADLAQIRTFAAGELIIEEYDEPDFCYLINFGKVQIFRNVDKRKLVLDELGSGSILGELSIIDGCPRSASAEALEDTETLALSKTDFTTLLHAHPEISLELLPIVINRLRKAHDDLYLSAFLLT